MYIEETVVYTITMTKIHEFVNAFTMCSVVQAHCSSGLRICQAA